MQGRQGRLLRGGRTRARRGDKELLWSVHLTEVRPGVRRGAAAWTILVSARWSETFTQREEFESAWPHLLKVKSKGAPIILVRGPKTDFMEVKPAGVLIHSPPAGQRDNPATPEAPIPAQTNVRVRWMNTTYIELVVDGNIVDLNRIPLPADTPIIDERFTPPPRP